MTSDPLHPSPAPDPSEDPALRLRRLRWHARRGLLENDLLIGRFLDAHGQDIGIEQAAALNRLLDLPDQTLLELLLGRQEPQGDLDLPATREVLAALREVRLQPTSTHGERAGPIFRPAGA